MPPTEWQQFGEGTDLPPFTMKLDFRMDAISDGL